MEIIDVVLGNREIDLLQFRRNFYAKRVRMTYVGESKLSHGGSVKPLYFKEFLSAQELEGVIAVEIADPSHLSSERWNSWAFENHSREWLVSYVASRHPNAVLMVCDIDEFPSLEQVDLMHEQKAPNRVLHLPMKMAYRRPNWVFSPASNLWSKAIFLPPGVPFKNSFRTRHLRLADGEPGLHASYLWLSADEINAKFRDTSHAELNGVTVPESYIAACDKYAIDHLGRAWSWGNGVLQIEDEAELNEIQKELIAYFPSKSIAYGSTISRRQRLEMSIRLSRFWKQLLGMKNAPKFSMNTPVRQIDVAVARALNILNSTRSLPGVIGWS